MDRATMNAMASDITAIIEQFLAQEQDTQVHTLVLSYSPAMEESPSACAFEITETVRIVHRPGMQEAADDETEYHHGVPIVFPEDGQSILSERQADDARLTAFNAQLQETMDDLVTASELDEYEQAVRMYEQRNGFPPLTTTARDLLRETANALIEKKDQGDR